MVGSSDGSQALSALATLSLNRGEKKWLNQRECPLDFTVAAYLNRTGRNFW